MRADGKRTSYKAAILSLICIFIWIGSFVNGGTSVFEVRETKELYIKDDRILNSYYRAIIEIYEKVGDEYSRNAERKLVEAERAWIEYRDLNVKAETALHESTLKFYIIMDDLTRERIERLKGMLQDMENHLSTDYSVPAEEALKRIKALEEKDD